MELGGFVPLITEGGRVPKRGGHSATRAATPPGRRGPGCHTRPRLNYPNLAENIWIADGPEAYVPGTHALSAGADFDYGYQQDGGYYMTDGQYAGHTLTLAQLKADFANDQAYAWVGIDDSGTTEAGYVTSVNGRPMFDILGLVAGHGDVTAYVFGL